MSVEQAEKPKRAYKPRPDRVRNKRRTIPLSRHQAADPLAEGYEAALRGEPADANPYAAGVPIAGDGRNGWANAPEGQRATTRAAWAEGHAEGLAELAERRRGAEWYRGRQQR